METVSVPVALVAAQAALQALAMLIQAIKEAAEAGREVPASELDRFHAGNEAAHAAFAAELERRQTGG